MISASVILTERMELIPATTDILKSDLTGKKDLSRLLNASVPDSWPPENLSEEVLQDFIRMESEKTDPYFTCWYWIKKERKTGKCTLIGSGGIASSKISEDTAAIGYSVLDDYQGFGYATEAVSNMIPVIFRETEINRIIATTYPELAASIRVLEKNGFLCTKSSGTSKGIEEGILCYVLER